MATIGIIFALFAICTIALTVKNLLTDRNDSNRITDYGKSNSNHTDVWRY